jgi:hypothetical protein
MTSKMQSFKLFVDSEPKTQLVDSQVEEVLNENWIHQKETSTNTTWTLIDNVKMMTFILVQISYNLDQESCRKGH